MVLFLVGLQATSLKSYWEQTFSRIFFSTILTSDFTWQHLIRFRTPFHQITSSGVLVYFFLSKVSLIQLKISVTYFLIRLAQLNITVFNFFLNLGRITSYITVRIAILTCVLQIVHLGCLEYVSELILNFDFNRSNIFKKIIKTRYNKVIKFI